MKILGMLESIGAAYSRAAKAVSTKISGPTSLLHTGIGAIAAVIATVGGGLLYYLFGSTSEACKGAPSTCVSRRDWVIIPSFVILQFSAIVILALLNLADKKKPDIISLSWFVYGLCLGLSSLLGIILLFDMYAMNSWLVILLLMVLFGVFSYVHASYWHNATKKQ